MFGTLEDRLDTEPTHYRALVKAGALKDWGMVPVSQHFGSEEDRNDHIDLRVKMPRMFGNELIIPTAMRIRNQRYRTRYDQITLTGQNTPGCENPPEVVASKAVLYIYGWHNNRNEITEAYLALQPPIREMEPDTKNWGGGYNGKQELWGWNFSRLKKMGGIILAHWERAR